MDGLREGEQRPFGFVLFQKQRARTSKPPVLIRVFTVIRMLNLLKG